MISTWPKVQAVTGPDDDAETIFDFTRVEALLSCTVAHAGWSIGVPELAGDVDAIHPVYTERALEYDALIEGTEHQALYAQSTLARWLLSGPGWLRVQLSPTTEAVTFRTYRARPGALSLEHVIVDTANPSRRSLWKLAMEIPAEPFAYGRKVTLDPITLSNDPSASNGCHVVVPEVRGDAPAPFRFDVADVASGNGSRWMMSVHAGQNERLPIYLPIESATLSGSAAEIAAALPDGMTSGRWKVFLRAVREATSGVHIFKFGQASATVPIVKLTTGPVVVSARGATSDDHAYWADLGEFTFPAFGPPVGEVGDFLDSGGWYLEISAPGDLDPISLDGLLFVPVELVDTADSCTVFTNIVDGLPYRGVWDGDLERFWAYTSVSGGTKVVLSRPEIAGRFPDLIPGAVNVLTILRQVNGPTPPQGGDASDDITDAGELTLSYYPRHLYLGQG